jgi:hypothetical protein
MRRMNLLPIKKLASLALAAGALTLVSAAPAAAADLPWKPGQAGEIRSTDMSFMINDSEQFSTVQESFWQLHYSWGWLGWTSKGWTKTYEKCGGNEVRVQVELTARTNVFQVYDISARAKLYEGASCNTNDLDGKTPYQQVQLRPGAETGFDFYVKNTEEGGDSASVSVDLVALPLYQF